MELKPYDREILVRALNAGIRSAESAQVIVDGDTSRQIEGEIRHMRKLIRRIESEDES